MTNNMMVTAVLMDEYSVLSFVEVCKRCDISAEQLHEMIEHGLFQASLMPSPSLHFTEKAVARIQAASRLQRDLEINLPGIALVLDLLDEIETIRNELISLQHHMD